KPPDKPGQASITLFLKNTTSLLQSLPGCVINNISNDNYYYLGGGDMAQAKNIRLYTPAGEKIDDLALAEDYLAADKAGPFRVGRRALYYRDGGLKRYCIPLEQIDHAFTRVVACATHCCCGKMD